MRVVHITTAHPAFDVRIFHKECRSLAAAGHQITLIASHERDGFVDGVNIRGIPKANGRIQRMTKLTWRAYREALLQRADVYHFHDPELIPMGLLLRMRGKSVVYDMHENVPQDILGKDYLPSVLRWPLAVTFNCLERVSSRFFSGMVAATPAIARRFTHLNGRLAIVQNFPSQEEFDRRATVRWNEREMSVVYAGCITRDRGIREMVEALDFIPESLGAKLRIAGAFSSPGLRQEVQTLRGWNHVVDAGFLRRPQLCELLGQVRAGLLVFHPDPNNVQAQPNKLFEYMAAGIPVIASDFPLWKKLVGEIGCGLLVDPLKPAEIAKAIEYILTHPAQAEAMGVRGQMAIRERYHWENEKAKLLRLYERFKATACVA